MPIIGQKKLPREFYLNEVTTVAKNLLGKIFVHTSPKGIYSAKIVEVEAYQGFYDQASHSFKGRTERNKVMFMEGGRLYVYLIYGIHFCANIVSGANDIGDAILIRAAEPLQGINLMYSNRSLQRTNNDSNLKLLTNGPAKFCSALDISKKYDGEDLTGSNIYLLEGERITNNQIVSSQRIGISKSKELKWRYYIKNNKFVSKT